MDITNRLRRNRKNPIIREMVAETRLHKDMLVYPVFAIPGKNLTKEISSMPGIFNYSVDELIKHTEKSLKLGVNKLLIFGVGEEKSENAISSHQQNSIVSIAISELKKEFKDDIFLISDVCLCAYTTHGHCGVLENGYVKNDESVDILTKMALSHARAGVDMVAPSDMMDGRVGAIRSLMDSNGFTETSLMSYSIKYASAYYGPFREAADSSPQTGDRKAYQMDYRNSLEAMQEAVLDENEGADILMVKPALAYLDVIKQLKLNTNLPIACYNVSGEYSMVKAASLKGWVDEGKIVRENLTAFARAGASIIITYHALDALENNWL
ncbi:MAG: porphobilinogen synthase [Bacteroidota bacterium]|jgi:porphobilinogen synthase